MHSFSSTQSGAEPPSAEAMQAWARRSSPPENEIPVGLTYSTVLGRTDEVAIGLTGFQLYSNGLAFTMVIRLRRTYRHGTHPIHDLIGRTTAPDSEPFLFGVQYADGRTATNVESGWPMNDAEDTGDPDRPLLTTTSGSGGDRSVDQGYWLAPLPPGGPLLFVGQWTAIGLTESRVEVDGTEIFSALDRVHTLWPWERAEEHSDHELPGPQLPTTGWFAGTHRPGSAG